MITDAAPGLSRLHQAWRLLACAAIGGLLWLATSVQLAQQHSAGPDTWFYTGDPLVGIACLVTLVWRRRFPLTVALATALASAVSTTASAAALLALCSLATRRRPMEIGAVLLVSVAASQAHVEVRMADAPNGPLWLQLVLAVLVMGITVAVGVAVGARRTEVRSLQHRAESAEREQLARAAQARTQERARIAREMHDVLAHRISLVAMQAGVLNHRADLSTDDRQVMIRGIADGAHQALEELRDVLGVLRADPDRPEQPQPTVESIPDLVTDARTSGLEVTWTTTVRGTPPETIGRACYRVVQEGLTNAAKHAPGAAVHVSAGGMEGHELRISVANSPATGVPARRPESGFGLLGLTERITLLGGELDHRRSADGGYLLAARLPWPRHDDEKRA
ncbi:signal transduction histidine kinase [Prauserella sediminis]|uniref:histidine kinase n=1 Tax=Prauserella sediminis TaxID=577680 RepID=A0A839XN49_9PSEU|nr:histidine kinase [Prauserella sediminis]MBB3662914.1 signal transduction histidine kinase [Prauserella sediminis]